MRLNGAGTLGVDLGLCAGRAQCEFLGILVVQVACRWGRVCMCGPSDKSRAGLREAEGTERDRCTLATTDDMGYCVISSYVLSS